MLSLSKHGRAALAAMFTVVGLAACTHSHTNAAAAKKPAQPPVRIAVIGDSLALGTGASDSGKGFAFDAYRTIAIERPGSEITNVAIGGTTAADVLRLETARLASDRYDVVIVCVGGNDVVRFTPPPAFASAYAGVLTAVRHAQPRAAIVAVGVPDVAISPLFADRANLVRMLAASDDRAARAAARRSGARYLDLFALTHRWRDPAALLSADRFHPSDAGHAAIAAALLPILRQAFSQVPPRAAE